MSDAVWIALVVNLPALVAALGAFIVVIRTAKKVELVHLATNSMKDALVASTRSQALLEGHAEGVKDEKLGATHGDAGTPSGKVPGRRAGDR